MDPLPYQDPLPAFYFNASPAASPQHPWELSRVHLPEPWGQDARFPPYSEGVSLPNPVSVSPFVQR